LRKQDFFGGRSLITAGMELEGIERGSGVREMMGGLFVIVKPEKSSSTQEPAGY